MATKLTQLPVYQKALEVFKISRAIAYDINDKHLLDTSPSGSDQRGHIAGELIFTSLSLAPGLAVLLNSSSISFQHKKAKQIRKSVQQLMAYCRNIENYGARERTFISLLRKEVKQFDQMFTDWLQSVQGTTKKS